MKDAEDEAFDEIARKQGGGFMAKRAMAADKLREPVCDKDPQDCWNVRCQLGKQCKNLAQPSKPNSRRRTMEREALNLAIIALGCIEYGPFGINDGPSEDTTELAITAIKEALAQPAQEPHEYDWSMLEAAKESLREHMARIKELEAALKQALEALEHISKFGCNHVRGVCTCEYREAADAIKAALAQPEPDMLTIAYQSGYHDGKQAALAGREWNFCERCGKRTADKTVIHTCTPPQGNT